MISIFYQLVKGQKKFFSFNESQELQSYKQEFFLNSFETKFFKLWEMTINLKWNYVFMIRSYGFINFQNWQKQV